MNAECVEPCVELGLRSRANHTTDTLGAEGDRKVGVGSSHHEVRASGGTLSLRATSEIGVGKQVWRNNVPAVAYITHHPKVVRGVDVAHQPVEFSITCGVPLCNETGKMAYGA